MLAFVLINTDELTFCVWGVRLFVSTYVCDWTGTRVLCVSVQQSCLWGSVHLCTNNTHTHTHTHTCTSMAHRCLKCTERNQPQIMIIILSLPSEVNMTRPRFNWGPALADWHLNGDSTLQRNLKAYMERFFSWATFSNSMKWLRMEPSKVNAVSGRSWLIPCPDL